MAETTAPQVPVLAVGEVRNFAVSFVGALDTGELLTGTPAVAEQNTTDLTITNKAVNTVALTINGQSVAIGQAVQFRVAGQLVAHSPYAIKITVGTTSSPAQTLVKYVEFTAADGADPTLATDADEEATTITMPALTGDVLVDTLNALLAERLAVARDGPKVSYSLHGHTVSWTAYLDSLDKRILALRREIAQTEPWEEIGFGF